MATPTHTTAAPLGAPTEDLRPALTRRGILGAVATAAAASVAVGLGAPALATQVELADPHAALAQRLAAAQRAFCDDTEELMDATGRAISDAEDRIFAAPAVTLAGLLLKIEVLGEFVMEDDPNELHREDLMLRTIVLDARRLLAVRS